MSLRHPVDRYGRECIPWGRQIADLMYQAYQDSRGIHHVLPGTHRKSNGKNSGSLEKF